MRRNSVMRSSTAASRSSGTGASVGRVSVMRVAPVRHARARSRSRPGSPARGARCRLRTTRQYATLGSAAIAPPSYPAMPTVSRPRSRASPNASSRFREFPLVEMPSAMSPADAWAMSCRENTRSKPTSLAIAVITAVSSSRHRAGTARPSGGRAYSAAIDAASVELPPLPKVKRRTARGKGGGHASGDLLDDRSLAFEGRHLAARHWPRPWPRPTARDQRRVRRRRARHPR